MPLQNLWQQSRSQNHRGALSTHNMSLAAKIQQMTLCRASILPAAYYSLQSQSWMSSAASLSISMPSSSLLSLTLAKLDVYGILSQSPHKVSSLNPATSSVQVLKMTKSPHTSETAYQTRSPPIPPSQPICAKPTPYPACLTPKPLEYCPHCAAKDCLHLWRPACSRQAVDDAG